MFFNLFRQPSRERAAAEAETRRVLGEIAEENERRHRDACRDMNATQEIITRIDDARASRSETAL